MKDHLRTLIIAAINRLQKQGDLPDDLNIDVHIERTRDSSHGDFACNVAMLLAKVARCKPRDIAEKIVAALPDSDQVERIGIAGPGFINFFINNTAFQQLAGDILEAGEAYGRSTVGNGRRVQVEFVSANPTGPLHVGHGRGAAYGAAVADLLVAAGYNVHREYYINDAGRQMDILATSTWLRYLQQQGVAITFPRNGYQGQYILEIVNSLVNDHGDTLTATAAQVMNDLPADENDAGQGDKEAHIDALIARTKLLLGDDKYLLVFDQALNTIIDDIRQDLESFGVVYEQWYSERSLVNSGAVDRTVQRLKDGGHLYQQDGAWWFRSTAFGDEKDRVVIRDNGQATYFASDIAYHLDKIERGYEHVIDIWGADHHGYVPRIKASLAALGHDPQKLTVLLVQFANLFRGGEKVQMSTRSGQFVTLRELRDEVGKDAARFFYVSRKCEQHMDFDLDLAKSQSNDNPVYYIQYAHARICSVMRQLEEKGFTWNVDNGRQHLSRLNEEHEKILLTTLSRYPETIESAAEKFDPHQIAFYLRDLAADFHTYYNAHQFIIDDAALRDARLTLIQATRQVLHNGLNLLGMGAPERM
jgi:arginyl-tRNA synthetase